MYPRFRLILNDMLNLRQNLSEIGLEPSNTLRRGSAAVFVSQLPPSIHTARLCDKPRPRQTQPPQNAILYDVFLINKRPTQRRPRPAYTKLHAASQFARWSVAIDNARFNIHLAVGCNMNVAVKFPSLLVMNMILKGIRI
jgi:hypothetical protein